MASVAARVAKFNTAMIKMVLMIEADNLPIVPVKIQGCSDNNTQVADKFTDQFVARAGQNLV